MVELSVVHGNILTRPCDLLILKHADGFYGVDQLVSETIGFSGDIYDGGHSFLQGKNIEARKVLFIGVGPLGDFRYSQIRAFAQTALKIAAQGNGQNSVICSPIHGPGYGLDENESFLALVGGFLDAIENRSCPKNLKRIEVVEQDKRRADRLKSALSRVLKNVDASLPKSGAHLHNKELGLSHSVSSIRIDHQLHNELKDYGQEDDRKTRIFVAMPFKADFGDEWEIAISEAAASSNVICERIDKQAYVGDILSQIKKRIAGYDGLLALLNESNPNVFLELGYAWAHDKPTILLLKKGNELPFDVIGQRCLMYSSIADLRRQLRDELTSLKAAGVFDGRQKVG